MPDRLLVPSVMVVTPSCAVGIADCAVDPGEVSVRSLVWPEAVAPRRLVLPVPMQRRCPSLGRDAGTNVLQNLILTPSCAIGLADRAADPGEVIARSLVWPEAALPLLSRYSWYSEENETFIQNLYLELYGVTPPARGQAGAGRTLL